MRMPLNVCLPASPVQHPRLNHGTARVFETENVDMGQVFLPFAMDAKGQTMYEYMLSNPEFLLGPGPEEE